MHCAFLVFSPLLFPPLPSRHFPFLLFPFPPLPFRWVTVKVKGCKIQGIFCSKFLAFAKSDSVFTDGFSKFSHTYQRSSEHESSISHNAAVAAVVSCQNSHDIASVINRDWLSCKKSRCWKMSNFCPFPFPPLPAAKRPPNPASVSEGALWAPPAG